MFPKLYDPVVKPDGPVLMFGVKKKLKETQGIRPA